MDYHKLMKDVPPAANAGWWQPHKDEGEGPGAILGGSWNAAFRSSKSVLACSSIPPSSTSTSNSDAFRQLSEPSVPR